jgi:hypothetical protein
MGIRIHNENVTGKMAVASDRDHLPNSESAAVTDPRIVSNLQRRVVGKPGCKRNVDLATKLDVVADVDHPFPGDPVQMRTGPEVPAILGAISLEERLTKEDTHDKLIGAA